MLTPIQLHGSADTFRWQFLKRVVEAGGESQNDLSYPDSRCLTTCLMHSQVRAPR